MGIESLLPVLTCTKQNVSLDTVDLFQNIGNKGFCRDSTGQPDRPHLHYSHDKH